jgi:prevent-host-death family protein
MRQFSALDLQRSSAPVQEAALREPIEITHHGRPRLVMMSTDEYQRLKRRDRQSLATADLPEEFVAALNEPYDDSEQAALNHLMDD